MNTIRKKSAKRLLLLILPFVPFVIFLNTDRANVVTLYAEYPTEVIAGTSFPITITIEKGNLDGFGRFSHQLPEGFTVDCDAQNFEFENNTVKLLWVNLPYSNSFTFTYTVNVPETYSGNFTIAANFGYVLDNERRFAELIPQTITVINDPLALRKYLAQVEVKKTRVRPEDITAYRSIQASNNEAIVSIRVNKKHLRAMSKIEELLPNGFSFYALERENAAFSTQNNVARFMWLEAPEKDIFTVSYKVIANPGYSIKDIYISGAFSYLEDGNTQSIIILERDMNAISESTGKPQEFETELTAQYKTGQDVSFSQQNLASNPQSKNISERAAYDLDPNVIQQSIPSTQVSTFAEGQKSDSKVASNPQSVPISVEQNTEIYAEDLETLLRQKQYSTEQVTFFTNTNIASQPSTLTQNAPVQSFEESQSINQSTSPNTIKTTLPTIQTQNNTQNTAQANPSNIEVSQDLTKSQVQRVETRTSPVAVNINAIPAPSTYFGNTHTETIDDPDMVSSVTNPSYSENMENTGLFGNPQEYSDEYVAPKQQQNTSYSSHSEPVVASQGTIQAKGTTYTQTPAPQVSTSGSVQGSGTTQASTTLPRAGTQINSNTQQTTVTNSSETGTQNTITTQTEQKTQSPVIATKTDITNKIQTQQTTIPTPKTFASPVRDDASSTQTNTQEPIINKQDIQLTQAELAFQSDLNIPSPLETNSQTNQTKTNSAISSQTSEPRVANNTTPSLQQKTTNTVTKTQSNSSESIVPKTELTKQQASEFSPLQNQTLAYAPQDAERTSTRLSNKNNTSQKETQISRIQNQNGNAGVYFRIQISASSKKVNTRSYFKRFKIRENVIVERIAEWYKYSVQKYETYVHARNFRNKIWSETPITDAFVVAYNGNNRITVQEALMITNQQWIK